MVSAPIPAVSAISTALCSTRSRLSGTRFLGLSLPGFNIFSLTLALSYIVR